jgi:hypothetical protein
MKAALALVAGIAIVVLGRSFGYGRSVVAVVVFLILFIFGFRYWKDVGLFPPEPEKTDVSDQGLRYVCSMCGLELKVEIAARDRAPTHCAEPMQLVREGQQFPLRPV